MFNSIAKLHQLNDATFIVSRRLSNYNYYNSAENMESFNLKMELPPARSECSSENTFKDHPH